MTLILSGTDGLSDVDGSAATPAIRGTDANTGIFFPAADTIAFSEGGVESMRIDSSGNVGIGRSPNYQLDVYRSGTTNTTVASANDNVVNILQVSGNTAGVIGTITSHPLVFTAGNTERMRIDTSGNVGIGTNSPSSGSIVRFLQVDNATSSGLVLNAARKFSIYSSASSTLSFLDDTAGAERMRIDSSGVLTTYGVTTASGAYISALNGSSSNTTVNSSTYNVTFAGSAKVFWVSLASGDGCLVITNYLTATITIVGTGGNIVASASPTASQLGISKSVNSHVVTFKTGSAAATQFGSWSVGSLSTSVS